MHYGLRLQVAVTGSAAEVWSRPWIQSRCPFEVDWSPDVPPTQLATPNPLVNRRATERQPLNLQARLTWKDQRGTTRFATVVTRNVSHFGVYVECQSAVSIPLYRLVQFQLERDGRESDALPESL